MMEALIGFPALTEAQRAAELLKRSRVPAKTVRMPVLPGKGSCAYGLSLPQEQLDSALPLLAGRGLRTGHVFLRQPDGALQEWTK